MEVLRANYIVIERDTTFGVPMANSRFPIPIVFSNVAISGGAGELPPAFQ